MKLQNLRLFQAACIYKNTRVAAEALGVSQSLITYAINELETEFDVILVAKRGRNLSLTREGEAFFALCNDVLERASTAENSMHAVAQKSNRVHIGMPPTVNPTLFSKLKTVVRAQLPGIVLQRYELGSVSVKEKLLNGQLDCAICPYENTDKNLFDSVQIEETEIVCCVGLKHPLAEAVYVSLAQLAEEPLVIYDDTSYIRHFIFRTFEKYGFQPNILMETSQLDTLRSIIAAGDGIGFMYKEYAEMYPSQIISIPIDGQKEKHNICFIWPKNISISSNTTKVLSCLSSMK